MEFFLENNLIALLREDIISLEHLNKLLSDPGSFPDKFRRYFFDKHKLNYNTLLKASRLNTNLGKVLRLSNTSSPKTTIDTAPGRKVLNQDGPMIKSSFWSKPISTNNKIQCLLADLKIIERNDKQIKGEQYLFFNSAYDPNIAPDLNEPFFDSAQSSHEV